MAIIFDPPYIIPEEGQVELIDPRFGLNWAEDT
jgi:hypothetical protein